MTSPPTSPPLAKASLYYYSKSIWSAVVLLCLEEKGYGPDELDLKAIDLNAGGSYTPSYLRVNPKGTVPCLVVPLEKTLVSGIENRYKALTESTAIVEFLDKARSTVSKTHTTSSAPAPTLSPATIALSNTSKTIIDLLHSPELSPMKFMVSARNLQELRVRAKGPAATIVIGRYRALMREMDSRNESTNTRFVEAWTEKMARFKPLAELFDNAEKDESSLTEEEIKARLDHFAVSDALWGAEIKRLFATLEKEIIGPLALGDQISLADLHLAAFVTRLVVAANGDGTNAGIDAIAQYAASVDTAGAQWSIGPKVRTFWETIIQRPSWKSLYGEKLF